MVLCSCEKESETSHVGVLRKKVWTESSYEGDRLLDQRITKVEYFDQFGKLAIDTLFFENDSGFQTNRYTNDLVDTSFLWLQPNILYQTFTKYDNQGNGISMTSIKGSDTTRVDFNNRFDNRGRLTELSSTSPETLLIVEFDYQDTLLTEKRTYRVENDQTKRLNELEKNYYDSSLFLISSTVEYLTNEVKDSTTYFKDDRGNISKILTFSNNVLVSTEMIDEKNGEEIITVIYPFDQNKVVRNSKSFYW